MNIGEILLIAAPSLGAGVVIGAALRGSAIAKLRGEIRDKDAWVQSLTGTSRSLREKLSSIADRHAERIENLRTDIEVRDRQLGRERAEIARLKPLAAKAEAAQRQRVAASHARAAKLAAAKAPPPTSSPKRNARAK